MNASPLEKFGPLMRRWRQAEASAKDGLWRSLENMAAAGADPFESGHREPCAFEEAVLSGSLAAIDLAAEACERRGRSVASMLNQTAARPLPGARQRPGQLASMLENCWLAAEDDGPGQAARTARRLLELGAHPEGLPCSPGRPLAMMVALGDVECARALIAAGADPRRRQEGGESLLHLAVRRREDASPMWALLIENGADPGAVDDQGRAPGESASHEQAGWLPGWLLAERERKALLDGTATPSRRPRKAPLAFDAARPRDGSTRRMARFAPGVDLGSARNAPSSKPSRPRPPANQSLGRRRPAFERFAPFAYSCNAKHRPPPARPESPREA